MSHSSQLFVRFGGVFVAMLACYGQSPTGSLPTFDAVAIKRNLTVEPLFYKSYPKRFSAKNMTAKLLMQLGWQTGAAKISAAPNWFCSDGFDIEAVTDRPVTWGEMQRMLQSVLTSRFHLTFHRETEEGTVYELAVAKSGIKMKLATDQTPWTGDHPNQPGTTGASMDIREGRLAGDSIPLAMFINFLSGETGRPVINKTGLTGRYVIDLEWTSFRTPALPDSAPDMSGESLFTAIQEQLGLKLRASKAPVQNIVIDHLEQPSEN